MTLYLCIKTVIISSRRPPNLSNFVGRQLKKSFCFDLIVIFLDTKALILLEHSFICRYDSSTGTFTVPSGGDGLYYFSVFLIVDGAEFTYFDVELNGQLICTVYSDLTESSANDSETTTCSGVAYAVEGVHDYYFIPCSHLCKDIILHLLFCIKILFVLAGDTVQVVYTSGTDTTPLLTSPTYYVNGFPGFRI